MQFLARKPTIDCFWRAVILFGRNSATYKFALGKSLLDLAAQNRNSVALEELAVPYSRNIVDHLRTAARQGTAGKSKFLDACSGYMNGTLSEDELVGTTVKRGFVNVLEAFHVVNGANLPVKFFEGNHKSDRIVITDELLKLFAEQKDATLGREVEARWQLVETAWRLDISPALLAVSFDPGTMEFYVERSGVARVSVTSARDALNGYQKGRCFYCGGGLYLETLLNCDVDHVIPHAFVSIDSRFQKVNINGVWNLVLACNDCNRGREGKFARLPKLRFLEKLETRNNYFIDSHHPLRETLIRQTGRTAAERHDFLQREYNHAIDLLIHDWEPPQRDDIGI